MPPSHSPSVETAQSWRVAFAALLVLLMVFGGAWITTIALKDIAAEVGGARSIPAFGAALAWLCTGAGGIMMGRLAEKIGARWTVMIGSVSIACGLAISTLGPHWPLFIGHGLFIGLFGLGGINAPLYVYISRWFDKRRGSALALISSGSYLAGTLWPPIFEQVIAAVGWRECMLIFAVLEMIVAIPIAFIMFRAPPDLPEPVVPHGSSHARPQVFGWPANLVFGMLCFASILCCITMSMPQQHIVAFCSDLGFTRTFGALALSVLLGTAFISRQIWGAMTDKIGGLNTVLIGVAWQAAAMAGFLVFSDEVGLIAVAGVFGLGFSGIIPAYVVALREHYPAGQAYWRIPTLLMFTAFGMGGGGWIAGVLYDHFGYYAPAWIAGIAASIVNVLIIGTLVIRGGSDKRRRARLVVTPSVPA
ncbi:MAG TPA: MFS transporter [Pseudolabrys sp.]|nr:MFS transporter [Pseudolabrys sp.]